MASNGYCSTMFEVGPLDRIEQLAGDLGPSNTVYISFDAGTACVSLTIVTPSAAHAAAVVAALKACQPLPEKETHPHAR